MKQQYLVTIDSGTQSTRVMIFDTKGNRIATGSAPHPATTSPQLGWHEHGKDDSWDALCKASKSAFQNFGGDPSGIVGIGVASQRICVNILGEDDRLIYNPISWMDNRWRMNIASMGEVKEDVQPGYKHFMAYFSIANWMKYNRPEIYEKAHKYMNVTGYLGARLTGEYRDTISNNIGWPYDVVEWTGLMDDKHIQVMGMRRDQLAEVVLPGGLIGKITAEAAAATGLPEGCPLYAAAGDKQCELLGSGVVHHGQGYITLGTLSGLDAVSANYTPSPTFGYSTYLAAYPKMYNYEAFLGKGFWLISWFRDNFGMDLEAEAKEKGMPIEAILDREAEALPAGAEGLVVLPDWSPGGVRPFSKGMFIGFDDRHKRAHVYRALIEGIVMEIKNKSDDMLASLGISLSELYVGGGGSRSDFCVQAIADVFNVPVHRIRESENTSLGVAICVAVGGGIYASFDQAIGEMANKFDTFQPVAANHQTYEALRTKVLNRLYPTLEDIMKDLADCTAPKQAATV